MSDPISLRIAQGIQARVQTISTSAPVPFHTDLGDDVELGQLSSEEDALQAVVFSTDSKGGDKGFPRIHEELTVNVEAQAPLVERTDGETVGNHLVADIQRAVEKVKDRTLGGLAVRFVKYRGRRIGYPEDGTRVVVVRVTYAIGFHRKYGAPDLNL